MPITIQFYSDRLLLARLMVARGRLFGHTKGADEGAQRAMLASLLQRPVKPTPVQETAPAPAEPAGKVIVVELGAGQRLARWTRVPEAMSYRCSVSKRLT